MKFPSHIVLDVLNMPTKHSSQYWLLRYLFSFKQGKNLFYDFVTHQKYYFKKELTLFSHLMQNQKLNTIRYNFSSNFLFLSESTSNFYKSFFQVRYKVKNRDLYSNHFGKEVFNYLENKNSTFDSTYFNKIYFYFKFNYDLTVFKSNYLWNLFDINFIRKEKIYTKLKYSRVPQYDIVSGGVAAIFAGFLGFLICEKFGFELLDSGDFYFLFMYMVFLFFFIRLFLKLMNNDSLAWNPFSLKWALFFYKTLFLNFFKFIFNFIKI